jgi:hypothetical protein
MVPDGMVRAVHCRRRDPSTPERIPDHRIPSTRGRISASVAPSFEGSMDNASGIAMMLDIARHSGAVPQARRPRTLVFLTTSDHHHGSAPRATITTGARWR